MRRNYPLLLAIAFLQGLVFYAPVATNYRLAYGISISELFAIESISWLLVIVLELPFGLLADRIGCKSLIVAGNLSFALSKIIFAAARGFVPFLAERVLLSLALASLSGAVESLLAASLGGAEHDRAFGRWNAAGVAGLLVASLFSPLLYGRSLRLAAVASIPPYAIAAGLSLFLADEGRGRLPRAVRATLAPALRRSLRDKPLLFLLLAGAILGEYGQAATVFLSQLQYARAGIPTALYGPLFAAIQVAALASAGSGRLAGAMGRLPAMTLLTALACLGALSLALSDDPYVSILALLVSAASVSAFKPFLTVAQIERLPEAGRVTALSLNAMVMEGAAALINLGEGKAAQSSLSLGFGLFVPALCLVAAMLPLVGRTLAPRRAPGEARQAAPGDSNRVPAVPTMRKP